MKIMLCAYCKKEFEPAYSSSIYCSKECARKAYNYKKRKIRAIKRGLTEEDAECYAKESEPQLITCARIGCNNQFLPKNNTQKYCSSYCAQIVKREQNRSYRNHEKKNFVQRMNKTTFIRRLSHDLSYGR